MDNAYYEARRRVKVKKSFYKQLISFVGVSILLIFINVFTYPYYLWFLWAVVPWGITLLIRGLKIAIDNSSKKWEDDEIKRELIAMGKDPDEFIEDELELREIEFDERPASSGNYKRSDLV